MLGWLLGGLWLALLWAWLGAHPTLHADALYLHDLLQSLSAGRGLGGWDLPPAPSLVPDLGLLALARGWAEDLPGAQRLYGLLLGLGLWWALARLLAALLEWRSADARAFAAAGLLLALVLSPAEGGLVQWALPGHHGSAFVISLGLAAWGLGQKAAPSKWGRSLGLGLLLGLALHSDKVLWVWGCLPLGLLALRLNRAGQLRVLALLTLAAATAWLVGMGVTATGARSAALRLSYLGGRSPQDWLLMLGQLPGLFKANLALSAAALAAVALWAWPRAQRSSAPRVLLLAWVLVGGLSLILAGLAGGFEGRLLYPLLVLPAALLPAWVAERSEDWERPALLLPSLLALLWMASPLGRAGQGAEPPIEVRRALALDAVLLDRGLRYGWAAYGQARPLRLFSRQGTVCAPVSSADGRIAPLLWTGERGLFMQGDALQRPQFVVSNGLDPDALQAQLGTPPEIVTVQDLTVWMLVRATPRSKP
jgi:hypothetical protein